METRIQIAAMAMQGILARPSADYDPDYDLTVYASMAVRCADALLAELVKTSAAPVTKGATPPALSSPASAEDVPRAPAPAPEVDDYLEQLCNACRDGAHAKCAAIETDEACRCRDTEACRARTAQQEKDATPEVAGDDAGWWWAQFGGAWHLFHEKSPDTYCHEEAPGPEVELGEERHPPVHDRDAVCLECSEARCVAAIRWREARDQAAKAARAQKRQQPPSCIVAGCGNKSSPRKQFVCADHAGRMALNERRDLLAKWHATREGVTPPAEAARRAREIRESIEGGELPAEKVVAHG